MVCWILTQSEGYYPEASTRDWLSVHADEDEAREAFVEATKQNYGKQFPPTTYLIHVDTDTASFVPVAYA